jgi:ABC-type multidrug transport system fused ATPase/permease subunit
MTCNKHITFGGILNDFVSNNKGLTASYCLLTLMYPIRNVLIPHLVGRLTTVFNNKEELMGILLKIVFVVILVQIMSSLLDVIDVQMFPLVQKHIRDLLVNNVFDKTTTNFSEVESGYIVAQIIKFPFVAYGFILSWSNTYIPAIITMIASTIYIIYNSVYIGILFLSIFIVIVLVYNVSFKQCSTMSTNRDASINQIYNRVDDTLKNLKTVLSFNEQENEVKRINEFHPQYEKLSKASVICSLKNKYLVMALFLYILLFTCCVYFFKIVIFGKHIKLDRGTFIALSIIFYGLFGTLEKVNDNFKDSIFRWGTIRNCLEMINACDVEDTPAHVTVEQSDEIPDGIFVQGISFKNLFNQLTVSFAKGKVYVILGEIGSGKSTLVNMILKYYQPMTGHIYLDGVPYSNLKVHDIRKSIAYLPQNPQLFHRTIYENIVFGIPNMSKQQVEATIQTLGLTNFIQIFKQGLDTNVGVNGSKLSGGQKQIVWIIKISLMNPEYVILDEPTASLDQDTKVVIYKLLTKIIKNRTIIMITHDKYLLQFADTVYHLENGKIV